MIEKKESKLKPGSIVFQRKEWMEYGVLMQRSQKYLDDHIASCEEELFIRNLRDLVMTC